MRYGCLGFLIFAIIALPGVAHATAYPATSLLGGEVQQTVGNNQCYLARGFSSFQRNNAATTAHVSFGEMVANGLPVPSQMTMTFATTTTGKLQFAFLGSASGGFQNAPFTAYTQSYSTATKALHVTFKVAFPNCSLTIHGVYASP
jgi:hypothetical protein